MIDLEYLLKVSGAIALVSIPYYLVVRFDANLLIKRLYLAGGVLLSWTFPLLTIRKPEIVPSEMPVFFIDPLNASTATVAETGNTGFSISPAIILTILYLAGILFFAILNLISYIKIHRNSLSPDSASGNVIRTTSEKVFTVFRKIFLPEKYRSPEEIDTILIHERAHIRQLHFIDLLISEVSLMLTWFNPFSWLISRMIKENHEHLADREVLSHGIKPAHYKALLLNHALGGEVFRLGHQFNHSLTKKRFNMMKKMKATRKGIMKYIVFVPSVLLFTLMLTAAGQNERTIKGKVYLESTATLGTGATVVIQGTTKGTVVDRQGEFTLDVNGNPEISVSFIGYKTKSIPANKINRKGIILIPTAAEIPLSRLQKEETSISKESKKPSPQYIGHFPKSDNPSHLMIAKAVKKDSDEIDKSSVFSIKNEDGKEPVYLVDGEVVWSIEKINPDDIESVIVIKDPENPIAKNHNARNGIVMITTKAGSKSAESKSPTSSRKEPGTQIKEEEVFYVVEDIPSYPEGLAALGTYIRDNLVYPKEAKKKNMEGLAKVEFVVQADGSIDKVRIAESSNDIFNQAAMDVFKEMPNWKPGSQRGKKVPCKVIVPVEFELPQE